MAVTNDQIRRGVTVRTSDGRWSVGTHLASLGDWEARLAFGGELDLYPQDAARRFCVFARHGKQAGWVSIRDMRASVNTRTLRFHDGEEHRYVPVELIDQVGQALTRLGL